jgi:hypothetical protein
MISRIHTASLKVYVIDFEQKIYLLGNEKSHARN